MGPKVLCRMYIGRTTCCVSLVQTMVHCVLIGLDLFLFSCVFFLLLIDRSWDFFYVSFWVLAEASSCPTPANGATRTSLLPFGSTVGFRGPPDSFCRQHCAPQLPFLTPTIVSSHPRLPFLVTTTAVSSHPDFRFLSPRPADFSRLQ